MAVEGEDCSKFNFNKSGLIILQLLKAAYRRILRRTDVKNLFVNLMRT